MEMYKYIPTYKIRRLFADILYGIDWYIYRVKHYYCLHSVAHINNK